MNTKKKISIAFQGEHGAFSEIAARALMGARIDARPYRSTEEVVASVGQGKCTYGVVMMENSTEGTLHYAYDVLSSHRLMVIGEIYLRIHHVLLGFKTGKKGKARLRQIRRVYSHPQALAECAVFFRQHPWIEAVSSYDTAGMACEVSQRKQADEAAIASTLAARYYGLDIIADHVESERENYVRFGLVTFHRPLSQPLPGNKVSLILTLAHTPGSLSRFLVQCAGRGMNLTKIESRPLLARQNEYLFYVDFEHTYTADVLARTLAALKQETTSFQLLGSYQGGNVHRLTDT